MSVKYNAKGGKKAKNYGSSGGGMHKHATSGVAHNHAVSIARVREENERLEKEAELRKKRKGKWYDTVRDLFQDL